jgi:CubicO group peptidase (beta-lactamase class C family)
VKPPVPSATFLSIVAVCLFLGVGVDLLEFRGRYLLKVLEHTGIIEYVHWHVAPPEAVGIDREHLSAAVALLQERNTEALLIVKNDRLIHEWYSPGRDQNSRLPWAAAAKPLLGAFVLTLAAQQGAILLDQPVSEFVPEWRSHPVKSGITFRQLASHTSGLEDVPFLGNKGRDQKEEWRRVYEAEPWQRFRYSLRLVPLQEDPGTRYIYSGAGYYVISYALTRALKQARSRADLAELYQDKVLQPLGIHPNALGISYGQGRQIDGMVLYSIGSGARLTARAAARIAQVIKNDGNGTNGAILERRFVREMLRPAMIRESEERRTGEFPLAGIGWHLNTNGYFRRLPKDAVLGFGAGPQLICICPSLNLILVRNGGSLDGTTRDFENTSQAYLNPIFELFRSHHQIDKRMMTSGAASAILTHHP